MICPRIRLTLTVLGISWLSALSFANADPIVLSSDRFAHYAERFDANDTEDVVHLISNAQAWQWIANNAPLFECPSLDMEQAYYFRWWTYRKHIKQTPDGKVWASGL